jgi:hypothetical protein
MYCTLYFVVYFSGHLYILELHLLFELFVILDVV